MNVIFLILSVLYQCQIYLSSNLTYKMHLRVDVVFFFILCNRIMLKYFVEGEGLGGLKEKETVFMI